MNTPFPFGFPLPTAFYLTLYVLTLIFHVLVMNYVLAGTAYIAAAHFFPGRAGARPHSPLVATLKDWMPFALGVTITAGVAPLLFLQILYKENFYTANLLLFHRWMAIVPVLILGFYALYVLKSRWMEKRPPVWGGVVALVAWLCFAFTGYSWTENHLLSTQRQIWPAFYASHHIFFQSPELAPRLSVWFLGAIANMAMIAGWQLYLQGRPERPEMRAEARQMSAIALAGLVLSVLAAGWYYLATGPAPRAAIAGPLAQPYFVLALIGMALQALAWVGIVRLGFTKPLLGTATAGALLATLGMTVVREALRLNEVDIASLYHIHESASQIGGLAVFLIFFVVNAALIAWGVRLVVRGVPAQAGTPHGG